VYLCDSVSQQAHALARWARDELHILLAKARVVTDLTEQCLQSGDLRHLPTKAVCGQLADVVAGRVARTGDDEVVVFDSTGLAVQDLALCELLLST
jgi:ornithine cyclodeaminase/alanine dehydrogenase-like protein (mu-crystallin family)